MTIDRIFARKKSKELGIANSNIKELSTATYDVICPHCKKKTKIYPENDQYRSSFQCSWCLNLIERR